MKTLLGIDISELMYYHPEDEDKLFLPELVKEQILATIDSEKLTINFFARFDLESKFNRLLYDLELLTVSRGRYLTHTEFLSFLRIGNKDIFLKTPVVIDSGASSKYNYNLITKAVYLLHLGGKKIEFFKPIVENDTWNGSRKAIAVLLNPYVTTKMVKANKGSFVSKVRMKISHELVHNEQYLRRFNLLWKDVLKQYFNSYDLISEYYLRKDEISAYAMSVVDAYRLGIKEDYLQFVCNIKIKSNAYPKAWKKFVNTIFNILLIQNKDTNYIRNLANEVGLTSDLNTLQERCNIEIKRARREVGLPEVYPNEK